MDAELTDQGRCDFAPVLAGYVFLQCVHGRNDAMQKYFLQAATERVVCVVEVERMTQDDFTALATAHPNLTLGELRPVVFGQVLHPSPRKEGDREVHFIALRTVDRRCLIHLSVGQRARLTVSWWGQEHATKPGIQCDVTGDLADLERLWLETASLETPLLANRVLDMMANGGGQ